MKKNLFISVLLVIVGIGILFMVLSYFNKENNSDNLIDVKVAEVAHSVFYAPQYLADALGYFEDEGLDVEIVLANGADAVTSEVLSGDVDIGFCGTEATIYVVNKKRKNFCLFFKII